MPHSPLGGSSQLVIGNYGPMVRDIPQDPGFFRDPFQMAFHSMAYKLGWSLLPKWDDPPGRGQPQVMVREAEWDAIENMLRLLKIVGIPWNYPKSPILP